MTQLTKEQKAQLETLIDEFNCPFQKDDKCVMIGGARKLIERCIEIIVPSQPSVTEEKKS